MRVLGLLIAISAATAQQAPKTIAESVSQTLSMAEGQLLGIVEAMPESKYSFIPTAGCEKGGPSKAAAKSELIRYLRESFDYGNRVPATTDEKNALTVVDGRYAGPNFTAGNGGDGGVAHHRPLRPACRISADERHRAARDAEIWATSTLTG
ncbi:MAG: hypothetical protein LAO79_02220 [Acidobacteriia bacterium]|nr:hypothetical protein [Terriglobia bacterium]